MATKVKLGTDAQWGVKENGVLGFNDENGVFKAIELASSRASGATYVAESGLIADAEVGVPRIDWTNGVGELLLEPASTNYVTYSEDFSDASWLTIGSTTRTANYDISPDGTQTSTRIQFTTTNESVYKSVPTVVAGNYVSIYVKGTSGETIQFGMGTNVAQGQLFTLNGGWQRLEVASEDVSVFFIGTYQSATARDIEVWGAQAEPLNYSTSYIRNLTTGSTSRIADAVTGNSSLGQVINSSEGTFFGYLSQVNATGTDRDISLSTGLDNNNVVRIKYASSNVLQATVRISGVNIISGSPASTDNSFYKIAVVWEANRQKVFVNGVQVQSATNASTITANTLTTLKLQYPQFGLQQFEGRIRDLRVYDTALTDAELTTLTTI